jgi:hypothetical protein
MNINKMIKEIGNNNNLNQALLACNICLMRTSFRTVMWRRSMALKSNV